MAKRPTGVTILAILYLILGVVSIWSVRIYMMLYTIYSGISWTLTRFVVVASFIVIVYFITGWGLWRLRPWARIVALVTWISFGPLGVIIPYYLSEPEVKAAFQQIHPHPSIRTPTTDKNLDVYLPPNALKQLDTVTPIPNIEEVGKYAECPYCGSNIRETFYELGGIVRCDKCGAFHHRECFEYYGGKCGSSSCKLREA